MIHNINERDQLALLHDHHKRFSLEVYDHLNAGEEKEMLEAKENLTKTEKELEALKKRLYVKKS